MSLNQEIPYNSVPSGTLSYSKGTRTIREFNLPFGGMTTDVGIDLSYLAARVDDGKFPKDVLEKLRDNDSGVGVENGERCWYWGPKK